MKLSVVDRIIIILGLLPPNGSIEDMLKNKSIKEKIKLTKEEEGMGIVLDSDNNNNIMLKYISDKVKTHYVDIEFSNEEREYLKNCANRINKTRGVTETNLDTILMLTQDN